MAIFHINRIKSELKQNYEGLIDLSDVNKKSDDDKEALFLTRALSAYATQILSNKEASEIAPYICDGFGDNGIDCIYYDDDEKTLYLVQSKWNKKGNQSPDLGDIDKFIKGANDLISCSFSKFNDKVQSRSEELEDILYKTRGLKICYVLVHTGTSISQAISIRFQDLLIELNDVSDSFEFINLDQKKLFEHIQQCSINRINLENVILKEWGKKNQPILAYYGVITGDQISQWYEQHGKNLFSKNIRMILPDSEINSEIKSTVLDHPEEFWYFNNGITLIADRVTKRPVFGENRDLGIFDCDNISIINGAQTVGTIGKLRKEFEGDYVKSKKLEELEVQIRIISLECNSTNQKFIDSVTKANNRQNKVENRDFVSLEVNQKRLAVELRLMGIHYYTMRSEDNEINESSFDVFEATRVLSNSLDIDASTLIHREPNKVWSDIYHKRYTQLFNSGTKADFLWNAVRIGRKIDATINEIKKTLRGEDKSLLTYGEDTISCIVFSKFNGYLQVSEIISDEQIANIPIKEIIEELHPVIKKEIHRIGKGTPTIFKNFKHCKEIYTECMTYLVEKEGSC